MPDQTTTTPTWFLRLEDESRLANPLGLFQALAVDPTWLATSAKAALETGLPRHPVAGLTAAARDGTGLPGGRYVVGPDHEAPCILVVIAVGEPSRVVAFVPLLEPGVPVEARFVESTVLPGGVEAWTTIEKNGIEIRFYDTRFLLARAKYRPGKAALWRIAAIAIEAGPGGEDDTQKDVLPASVRDPLGNTIDLTGLSYFLPSISGPGDQAGVRGRIHAVREVRFAEKDAWEVDVLIPADMDGGLWLPLPTLVSRRAWTGRQPPLAGGFLEGVVHVQGYCEDVPFATLVE